MFKKIILDGSARADEKLQSALDEAQGRATARTLIAKNVLLYLATVCDLLPFYKADYENN